MVVFTCAHCGDSLQKPKVAKHYDTKCRNNCPDLCCVDCLKDFRGDEYVAHTKCISEAERYGAKGFVPKASQNKGEKKQDAWIEIVQSVLDENKSLSGSIRFLLEKISNQPNTPRKKIRFVNFVKSMSSRTHPREIDQVWDLLSAKLDLLKTVNIPKQPLKEIEKETTTENSATNDTSLNGEAENADDSQVGDSKKKRKKQDSESAEIILNGNSHNSDDAAIGESKKKKKKQKNGIHEDTVVLPISGSEKTNGISEFKKPKKDNTSEECINVTLDGNARNDNKDNLANKLDAMNIIEKDAILPVNEDNIEEKFSKKELKQKRKREKYEKELKEIESAPSQPCHIVFDDEVSASKKKNKKRKFEDTVQEPEETPVKLNAPLLVAEENDKPSEKKKKKTDAVSEFDWIGAITSVLGSKEKEISLKKLQKRVLAEYCSISGATEISERISKKYSKSLGKIQNVKIENDKARLVINEE